MFKHPSHLSFETSEFKIGRYVSAFLVQIHVSYFGENGRFIAIFSLAIFSLYHVCLTSAKHDKKAAHICLSICLSISLSYSYEYMNIACIAKKHGFCVQILSLSFINLRNINIFLQT